MIVITTGGTVLAEAVPNSMDVHLYALNQIALVNVVQELELQGFADGDPGLKNEDIESKKYGKFNWHLRTSRSNFALWLQSEALNYLDYRSLTAQRVGLDEIGMDVVDIFLP